ncbi:TPA: acetate--CoA ligase [Candidatus Dependentiae bacterium]|nr:MAG: Acetyl-coenzyme A synthetase [candidate division TM6 bacterium GW2011_GWF2_43_87]HBL98824.1 acetate--CoA ligase [Candidatus Dependentiae bacterium]
MDTPENSTPCSYENFWQNEAEKLPWFKPWHTVLDWQPPHARWFVGGEINASYACLDIHIHGELKDKTALVWCDETGVERHLTYSDLYKLVNRIADALKQKGVKKGDVVAIFMPLIPEAVAAMLAVARLGAIHCVIFSGFGADALRDRIRDVKATLIITADAGRRRGKCIPLKETLDRALELDSMVKTVVVVKSTGYAVSMHEGRDIYFDDFLAQASSYCAPEAVESHHPLFILHTSGSTGAPKGVVHATGGYLTYVYSTLKEAFGITKDDVYWCTADIGWITGHSYLVYAPLMHGATVMLYEGSHDYPTDVAWWQIIERFKVTIFYTAPTALRLFMKQGVDDIARHNLSSLRVLGSVGEPLNPQVWEWYARVVGGGRDPLRCPIIDTWWQTETGGFMIAPKVLRDHDAVKPGSVMHPLSGIEADIVSSDGLPVEPGSKGFLVIKKPWPGMLVGIWGDNERYKRTYWSRFTGMFDTSDCAIKDRDGCFWILGRSDEVIKISAHRIGTAEIETAVLSQGAVAESAAIGVDDSLRGQTIVLFVVLRAGIAISDSLKKEIIERVHKSLGRFIVITDLFCVDRLPKTRSGKILRRVLRALVQREPLGDLTTLEDGAVIEDICAQYKQFEK